MAERHNRHRLAEPMRLPVRQAEHVSGNQAARRPQRVVAVTEVLRSLMSAENETMAGEHQDEANGSHRRRPLWGHQPHTRRPERPRKNSQDDRQTVDPDPRAVGEKPPARLELAALDRHRVRLVRARLSSLTLPSPLSLWVGLAGLTPHELRHTAASLAVAGDATVKAVQRMLGHASATLTLDVNAHLFEHDLDQVAGRAAANSVRTESVGPNLVAVRPDRRQHR
ncbi:hypothetical protein [Micromonospora aurantiaca (nom. illeg.)]|uniref:hypothetical protein n=1 Tax=Micromonospora aurantiaca (nom. illeg.) TaxID=47850 RepID=UPI0033DE12C0